MRSVDIFHTIVVILGTTRITFPLFITYVICLPSPVETPFNEHGVYNISIAFAAILRHISHTLHVQLVGLNVRVHLYLMGFTVLFSSQKKFECVGGARVLFVTTIRSVTAIGFIVHCHRRNHRESYLCRVRFFYVIELAVFLIYFFKQCSLQSRKIGVLNKMHFVANEACLSSSIGK